MPAPTIYDKKGKWFWSRVLILGNDDCWNWLGAQSTKGYGTVWYKGRSIRAHHIPYLLEHGVRPDYILHACDNRLCCNPRHLSLGDNSMNAQDREDSKARTGNVRKRPSGSFEASIMYRTKRYWLGSYPTEAEAKAAITLFVENVK